MLGSCNNGLLVGHVDTVFHAARVFDYGLN